MGTNKADLVLMVKLITAVFAFILWVIVIVFILTGSL